ncbi:MAG: hypothetical protein ABI877_21530 [Gemmatimonadaceae bacterium]
MRVLTALLRVIVMLVKAISYEWILALVDMVRRWWDHIKAWCKRRKLPHPDRNTGAECVTTDHPAMRRPDPLIYSQSYLTQLGLPVTWDNPDIALLLNGVVVPENNLLPATLYEIEATIWNNSFNSPAIGMPVEFSFLSFGVATTSNPIGTRTVNVGAKGTSNHPAKTRIPWVTPASGGHFCIQVNLLCVDDTNPANNLGQNNVDVALAHSPAQFTFQLRNPRPETRRFSFRVDTYTPLELPDCDEVKPTVLRSVRIDRTVARHNAADFSIPAGWTVAISPAAPTLLADEEITVHVDVTPASGFVGEKPFNVNAFTDGGFVGGVTLVARVS